MGEEVEDTTVNELIQAQMATSDQMRTFITNYNNQAEKTIGYIDARLEGWEKLWDSIFVGHEAILNRATEADKTKKYFTEGIFSKLECKYYTTKGILLEHKNKFVASVKITTPAKAKRSTECKLPTLEVPTFNGNLLDWPSFSDLFRSTIHNNTELTNSQRLQYLKVSLKGDATNILRTTKVTDANFTPAWKYLEDRYNIKSALVHAQMHALLTQPKAQNASGIKSLFDVTTDCLNSIKNMGINVENWDPILAYLIIERLPASALALWNQLRFGNREVPTWDDVNKFLLSCCLSVENEPPKTTPAAASNSHRWQNKQSNATGNGHQHRSQAFHTSNYGICKMRECNENHSIRICPLFLKLDVKERIETARQVRLCLNCLGSGHKTAQCSSDHRCQTCNKKHHTLLHLQMRSDYSATGQTTTMNATMNSVRAGQILLATAIINVQANGGVMHQIRALIDSGSQSSFITERAVQKLKLKKASTRVQVYGLGRIDAGISPGVTRITFGSMHDPLFALEVEALVMPKLTNLLPSENVDVSAWKHLTGIRLADPNFFEPGHIDILIGANVYASIILGGVKTGECGMPIAQETVSGGF